MKITIVHVDTAPEPTPASPDIAFLRDAFSDILGAAVPMLKAALTPATTTVSPSTLTPVPAPSASTPSPVSDVDDEFTARVWDQFVMDWCQNFGAEGEQPDRPALLRKYFIGRTGGQLLRYVKAKGGLQSAVAAVLEPEGMLDDGTKDYIRNVYTNLCAVSSIIAPDLADLMEPIDHYAEVR